MQARDAKLSGYILFVSHPVAQFNSVLIHTCLKGVC